MQHTLTAAQQEIREAVLKICTRFGDDYWLAKDRDGGFPQDFHRAMADAGWLGIAMPEAYGGPASALPKPPSCCRRWRNRAPPSRARRPCT